MVAGPEILWSMKLRSHLLVLTFGTLLPMIAFAVIAAVLFSQKERSTFQRGATERTLALLTAVDTELRRSITTLEALATSAHLDTGDLRAFHAEGARVLTSQRDWFTINLAPTSAQQVVNVVRPFGTELPVIAERPSFDRVLQTGMPTVSNLVYGQFTKQNDFTVRCRLPRVAAGARRASFRRRVWPTARTAASS